MNTVSPEVKKQKKDEFHLNCHDCGKFVEAVMLALSNKHEVVFCDKPEPIKITKMPDFPEPVFCRDIQRKSKGDKRRDRSERRRKWRHIYCGSRRYSCC